MKKYLSMILVVAIAAVLSISAFAALEVPADQTVDVTLGLDGEIIHVYSVDIEYTGGMIFTYDKGGMKWVIDEGKGYSYDMTDTGWTDADQTLTIYNHSDLALGYTVTMAKDPKYNSLTFTLDGKESTGGDLPACAAGADYRSVNAVIPVVVTGTVPYNAADNDPLGVLTIAFEAR